MDSPAHSTPGQALVELTIVLVTITLLVTAAISLTATLMKEFKHSFVKNDQSGTPILPKEIESLRDYVQFFPKESRKTTLSKLNNEGWEEDRRVTIPSGLLVLLKGPKGHMGIIEAGRERIGVLYK
jgi:hypothetical protein